jgi:NitT/TauT family transport system ATP-binding protein
MQEFLLDVWRDTGMSILLVTHDVDEAVFLSERINVLSSHPGRVVEEINVPFGPRRTRDILRDQRCVDLVQHVRDRLRVWAAEAVTHAS